MVHKAETNYIELNSVEEGQVISVTAGLPPEAFVYDFTILQKGKMPLCDVVQTSPDGTVNGPIRGVLEGSGAWTTDKQNPVQRGDILAGKSHQAIAMSIGYGIMRIGDFAMVHDPDARDGTRHQLLPEISTIKIKT